MQLDRRSFARLALAGAALPGLRPARAAVSGTLVLYTSQLEPDAARTVQAFQALHPACRWSGSAAAPARS
jgi:iron(III) transport system substrate-binding protein